MARVVVTRRLPFPALDRLAAAHEVETWPGALPPWPDALRRLTADAEGLLCLLTDRIDAALIDASPRLRSVAVYAVGTDNVDHEAAAARGIALGNTPDVLTEATADLTWTLILASARRLREAAADVREGEWKTWEPAGWLGSSVHGATLGIVGWGRIGRAVARRASGFDMEVRHTGNEDLDVVLAASDIVSLHVPLTDGTRGLIGERELGLMKPSSILVNTARGGVLDHAALAAALHDGQIASAALDVTDPEPLPPDDHLFSVPNLLVVPHIGSATREARSAMADLAVDHLLETLA